ncbi:hypothetical protein C8250_009500 [Streptomyces sp. So13.3]|uniref:hypothetical protein n=1 Tax=Streptomyces sp. So13.3 TaxID=2136173 RepID=UPI001106AF90|nr:hypothetical protein [Streptomyces sp. So13.3]QNA72108.1 hypothetical protein C8250_009500 [Streptomyces sp. So13.3]
MSHPDFELYDNAGRDAEQISAARYGIATRADLLRWARRDAVPFLAEHPLPDGPLPSPDPAPYLAALAAAQTPAEVHAITSCLLDAAEPALRAMSDYLVAAAQWRGQHREAAKDSPPKLLLEAASRSLSALAIADHADLEALRAAYDPAPTPKSPTPGLASPPPSSTPPGQVPPHRPAR